MIKRLRFPLAIAALTLLIGLLFLLPFIGGATAHAAGGWVWPVNGDVITVFKNGSDPYAAGQHRGIDIASPIGTPVRAATGGKVTYSGKLPDSGNCVTVQSADGGYLVSYLHLSVRNLAKGDGVTAGEQVGEVGVTGTRSAVQPHLHLGVRNAASGAYVDPLPLLGPKPAQPATPIDSQPDANSLQSDPPAVLKVPAGQRAGRIHADTRAKAKARVHIKVKSQPQGRAIKHPSTRSQPQPTIVHAHSTGDSVAADQAPAAADSARESHAPRGRVAPPPLKVAAKTNLATPNLATPNLTTRGSSAPAQFVDADAASKRSSGSLPLGMLVVLLGIGAVAALVVRALTRVAPRPKDDWPLGLFPEAQMPEPVEDQTDAQSPAPIRLVGG